MTRCFALFGMGLAFGCQASEDVDAVGVAFMEALAAHDFEAAAALCSPTLKAELLPARFHEIAWYVEAKFGALGEKTGTSISVEAGGPIQRRWNATFAKQAAPVEWVFIKSGTGHLVEGFRIVEAEDADDPRSPETQRDIDEGSAAFDQVVRKTNQFMDCFSGRDDEVCGEVLSTALKAEVDRQGGISHFKQGIEAQFGPLGNHALTQAYQTPMRVVHALAMVELDGVPRPLELIYEIPPGPLKLDAFRFLAEAIPNDGAEPSQDEVAEVIEQIREDAASATP